MSIKICFVGAHGTGKTTLAFEVYKWLKREKGISCKLLCESSDKATAALGVPQHGPFYEEALINYRRNLFAQYVDFISDRSLIDPLGYQKVKLNRVSGESYREAILTTQREQHILFYIPVAIILKGEGRRPESAKYQHEVAKAIKDVIKSSDLRVYTLSRIDLGERLAFIQHILTTRIKIFGGSNAS